jgi:hypothetical protein
MWSHRALRKKFCPEYYKCFNIYSYKMWSHRALRKKFCPEYYKCLNIYSYKMWSHRALRKKFCSEYYKCLNIYSYKMWGHRALRKKVLPWITWIVSKHSHCIGFTQVLATIFQIVGCYKLGNVDILW